MEHYVRRARMKLKVFLASGGTVITEAHEDRCWYSEEVDSEGHTT